VTKVRTDSAEYLDNVLKSAHGSVLEHANFSFLFEDVSRVFTHELVRHRAGCAFSQESMRYVRLNNIPIRLPDALFEGLTEQEHDKLLSRIHDLVFQAEDLQRQITDLHHLDEEKSFARKKGVTSAMRRFIPDGVSTTILWTANIRTIRFVIKQRTEKAAEEEIRLVFQKVARMMQQECPLLFADFEENEAGEFVPKYHKV